jgi:hypothetical protein
MKKGDVVQDQNVSKEKQERMSWEKPYLEALIDQLKPSGEVLEIGFGLGYSADRIQAAHPTHHTIIEPNPNMAKKAMEWAKGRKNVSVIQDTWEKTLPKLGVFDSVFFNDFDPDTVAANHNFCEASHLFLQKGKDLVDEIKKTFPSLTKIRYSDADLQGLFGDRKTFDSLQMANFLHELRENGQITKEQQEKFVSKYQLPQAGRRVKSEKKEDEAFSCLKECLEKHMKKGSRFSCFSCSPVSKFENPEFFDLVITNPDLDYYERWMEIDVPTSCKYYKHKEALVLSIQKQV